MQIKTKIILSFLAIAGILVISGCGFKQTNPKKYSLNLEVWGLFDNQDAYNEIFENYRKLNPNIGQITYKKFTQDTYKKELLDALASGQGPDIFLIRNTWLSSFGDKVVPAPQTILTEQKFRSDFVDVAANDFVSQGQVYAVPLNMGSLALYYNKDLFNEAGITRPPQDWNEFITDAKKMTKFDSNGQITKSGAALGIARNSDGSESINRATDILNLLLLQNQTNMVDIQSRRAMFDQIAKQGDNSFAPGENALIFYTGFANKASFYTWDRNMHNSIDAFSEGNVAMMFNYPWNVSVIKDKQPKLNFGIAPVPQLQNSAQVDYADYWGFTVARNKTIDPTAAAQGVTNDIRAGEAWSLLAFLATKPDQSINSGKNVAGKQVVDPKFDPAINYLTKVNLPSARRDLIELQKNDPILGVFAQENLIAKSWYQVDPDAINAIFSDMITQVNLGQATVSDAIKSASAKVTRLMQG